FAVKTMRIFLFTIMLNGVQMTIANYFSAIGKPVKGIILSLSRQILLFVPLLLILPLFMGLEGVLYAAPITDATVFLLALVLIIFEFRHKGYKEEK
ncbi:MAG: MATE family efflux transporter, partial [Clostridia bacterium]|nr:MATE family efflux transporter [Clostridia bacterium]